MKVWSKVGKLLIPHDEPEDPEIERRRRRYEQDPEFKKKADKIHEARLMSGPACDDCLRLAENKK